MNNQTEPKISKAPFIIADLVLLALAGFIYWQSSLPMGPWELGFVLVCCAVGAGLMVTPYLIQYQALIRVCETSSLASSLDQIKDLQSIAALIGAATARWQAVQEQSDKTVGVARAITDQINSEAAAFTEFLQKANDGEKANLRLEVEKLRRTETEWLQALVRMLDHTYALHQAAVRTGQPGLIEQLGNFQNACRDVARRVGLAPFAAAASEPFNAEMHQVADDSKAPGSGAAVDQTIATGYTFQGRLVRPALVTLRPEATTGQTEQKKEPSLQPNGNGKGATAHLEQRLL